jgi:membrane protease YdiL (CAAX protease family)
MKKESIRDLMVFIVSFILYYIFGTGLIYLILKTIYNGNSDIFPSYLNNGDFVERGLSNIAQLISSFIILIVLGIIYFRNFKGHFTFLKDYKLIFKTLGYALFVYFVTICYNLFLPLAGGTGEDGSNVALIKESMKQQYWIMFLMVVIFGPFIEEILFRFIPFKSFKERTSKNVLLVITSIMFTVPHMFSLFNSNDLLGDLLALPKFLIIGWMLGEYYYKNNDIGRVIFVHMIYNIISFVLMSVSLALI